MRDKIIRIINDVLEKDVNESTTVEGCENWTSLKMLQIVMALEEINITIPIEKISRIHSVTDLINLADEAHG